MYFLILLIRDGKARLERKVYSASSAGSGFLRNSLSAEAPLCCRVVEVVECFRSCPESRLCLKPNCLKKQMVILTHDHPSRTPL